MTTTSNENVSAPNEDADNLHEIATRVIGSSESAQRWMTTPALALNGACPAELLATPEGRRRVREHLARIEHGIYT